MKRIIKKLTNTKTVIAIVSSLILILSQLGFKIDNELIMNVVEAICYILVVLGIMNDDGMKTTDWNV